MNCEAKDIYSKIARANYGDAKWVQEMALKDVTGVRRYERHFVKITEKYGHDCNMS